MYYFVYLEISLKKDDFIYAQVNISNIPMVKLIEIFRIDTSKSNWELDGYPLSRDSFKRFKHYLNDNVGHIDLEVFEYCLYIYQSDKESSVREMYKLSLIE